MGRLHLYTGGARSGKSALAQERAESLPGPRVYVATCPVTDEEMEARIRRHQAARGPEWQTAESPVELAEALRRLTGAGVVLVDCLTLWVSNLMWKAEQAGTDLDEDAVAAKAAEVAAAARSLPGEAIFVTNEVGLGIVPDNPVARRFRDLAGRCNQTIAAEADAVTLVACGLPLRLKGA